MKKIVRIQPKKMTVCCRKESNHEKDFYKWSRKQAGLMRKQEFSKLDWDNIIEEIESLGRSEKRCLKHHLKNMLMHLLKVQYQKSKHTRSWDSSIKVAKIEVLEVLADNPSLKNSFREVFEDAYDLSRQKASAETGLSVEKFPETCPWSVDDLFPELKIRKK